MKEKEVISNESLHFTLIPFSNRFCHGHKNYIPGILHSRTTPLIISIVVIFISIAIHCFNHKQVETHLRKIWIPISLQLVGPARSMQSSLDCCLPTTSCSMEVVGLSIVPAAGPLSSWTIATEFIYKSMGDNTVPMCLQLNRCCVVCVCFAKGAEC